MAVPPVPPHRAVGDTGLVEDHNALADVATDAQARLATHDTQISALVTSRPINVRNQLNPLANAVMDGAPHPLSSRFTSLTSAQAVFPGAVALTDEIDYWSIQLALNSAPKVFLPWGTGVVHRDLLTVPNQTIEGDGQGITTLFLRAGSNTNVISPADQTIQNDGMVFRKFTIDGNSAGNTGAIGQTDGLLLVRSDNLILDNLEVQNVNGRGIHHHGLTGSVVKVQSWNQIYVHDNQHWGIWNTNGVRIVSYDAIKAINNGLRTDLNINQTGNSVDAFTGGICMDHSECLMNNIDVHNNKNGDGLWVRNVFSCNLNSIRATQNDRHGIRILGLVDSEGNNWLSQGNGQINTSIMTADIYFDGQGGLNYGVTTRTRIDGIVAGPNHAAAIATQGSWASPEDWAIFVDNNVGTGDLTIQGRIYPGALGTISQPSPVGDFNWDPGTGTVLNVDVTPPSIPPNFAVDNTSITPTSANISWSAATDNVGVTGYRVYLVTDTTGDGTDLTQTQLASLGSSARSYTLNALTPNADNNIWLTAFDAAGNESDAATLIITTNQNVDSQAPTVPVVPTTPTFTTANVAQLDWPASSDTGSGVDHYNVYQNGATTPAAQPTTNSVQITGLTAATSYTWRISAVDVAGNESALSAATISTTTSTAVAFRASATAITTTTGPGGPTVTIPASVKGGDFMIMPINAGSGATFTTPSGWSLGHAAVTGGTTVGTFFYKFAAGTAGATSTDASTTVHIADAVALNVQLVTAYSGVDATTPVHAVAVAAESSSTATHTLPELVTTVNGCRIIGILMEKDPATNITTVTPPVGWSSGAGLIGTGGSGNQQSMYMASDPNFEPPGDFTGLTMVTDQPTVNAIMWTIALAPAGSTTDNQNPTQVTGLAAGTVKPTQIPLTWNAATDNSGVIAGYKVYGHPAGGDGSGTVKADTLIATLGNVTSYTATGLTASTEYPFAVSAFDPSGNEGTKSGTIRPTTAAGTVANKGIFYGLNADNFTAHNEHTRLGERTVANGWVGSSGGALVDTNGNSINLGITRCYYSGTMVTPFSPSHTTGGLGTNTHKRANLCWNGGVNADQLVAGNADAQFCNWCNSLPAGWTIWTTWHHEPNKVLGTSGYSDASYKAAWQRIGALIENRAMPSGQPAKAAGAPAISLAAGTSVHSAINYTLWTDASANHGVDCVASIPPASTMDAGAILLLDAYQNPPPPITGSTYPTPGSIWNYFFANNFTQLGYDQGQHGYGIGEWMCPVRSGDNQTTFQGQADAIDSYLAYHEARNPQPKFICMWENPASQQDANATYIQWAHPKARTVFVDHALGPNAAL